VRWIVDRRTAHVPSQNILLFRNQWYLALCHGIIHGYFGIVSNRFYPSRSVLEFGLGVNVAFIRTYQSVHAVSRVHPVHSDAYTVLWSIDIRPFVSPASDTVSPFDESLNFVRVRDVKTRKKTDVRFQAEEGRRRRTYASQYSQCNRKETNDSSNSSKCQSFDVPRALSRTTVQCVQCVQHGANGRVRVTVCTRLYEQDRTLLAGEAVIPPRVSKRQSNKNDDVAIQLYARLFLLDGYSVHGGKNVMQSGGYVTSFGYVPTLSRKRQHW